MARELSLSYGGVTFGGTSGRELHGVVINTKRRKLSSVRFMFTISKTTEAAFGAEITTVEDALRKPYQDFTLTQGSTTLYSYLQSSNTGMDSEPSIDKREEGATGRSRRYEASITFTLPANTGAELVTGLSEHNVEVAYDPARIRTITVAGEFTAVGGSNARAQYEANISALETSVFSALSITAANRELVEEPTNDSTYNTKTMTFRRVWRELIFSQGGASFNDTGIVRQRFQLGRLYEAPGDTPGVSRLATLPIQYDCWLDKAVTTNILGKWSSIRAWVFQQIQAIIPGGKMAVIEEEPSEIPDENRLSVRIVCKGTTGSDILMRSISIQEELSPGWALVNAWTGNPLSKYDYQGPATLRRTITDTKTVRGFVYEAPVELKDGGANSFQNTGISVVKAPVGLSSKHVSSIPQFIHRRMGREGKNIDVTDIVKTDVFEFFAPIKGGNSNATVTA